MSDSKQDSLKACYQKVLEGVADPYGAASMAATTRLLVCQENKKGRLEIALQIGYPCAELLPSLKKQLSAAIASTKGDNNFDLTLDYKVMPAKISEKLKPLTEVSNIIAVSSAKGGVGKSTVAVNLAVAMAVCGARVGILDADIYGPSLRIMLGIADGKRPDTKPPKYLVPIAAHGLQTMSISYLLAEKAPAVWRGPMVSGALQQMSEQTLWKNLDYLIVDMPPGTGDIALTLAQKVPVAANIVVTTPQPVALSDARRGIAMLLKFDLAILGIVENMAYHECGHCGERSFLFGTDGAEALAKEYNMPVLASLPLDIGIRENTDSGNPIALNKDLPVAKIFKTMAQKTMALLASLPVDKRHNTLNLRDITDAMA